MSQRIPKYARILLSEKPDLARYIYGLVCEEAAEATKEAAKLLRFGEDWPRDHLGELKKEMDDLQVVYAFVNDIRPKHSDYRMRAERMSWRVSRVMMELTFLHGGRPFPLPPEVQGVAEFFRELIITYDRNPEKLVTLRSKADTPDKVFLFDAVNSRLNSEFGKTLTQDGE